MKKISTLLFILLCLSAAVNAQVFWTENFGTTCRFQDHANTFVDGNGAWTETRIGENDTTGNEWYISDRSTFDGDGNCAAGNDISCQPTPNNSLHVGGLAMPEVDYFGFPIYTGAPEDSTSYWTGFFYQYDNTKGATTDKRIESPAINCTSQSSISISFDFYNGGDTAGGINGDCRFWYYDGTTWSMLLDMPKTEHGGCNNGVLGIWRASSAYPAIATLVLPASANGNPNVKIGFEWTNNTSATGGTDPSFAVDNITLSSGSGALPPVAKISAVDSTGCAGSCFNFTDASTNSPTSWLWTFTGAADPISTVQNPQFICYVDSGTYSVKLVVTNSAGSDSITLSNFITVIASPPAPSVTQGHDTLFCSFSLSYASYQWYIDSNLISSATKSYYIITSSGNYNVKVTNSQGCAEATGINAVYVGLPAYSADNHVSIFPVPAADELTVTGNWQSSTGILSVYDVMGKKVDEEIVKLDDTVLINIKNLPEGIYFLQMANDKARWIGKFVKD